MTSLIDTDKARREITERGFAWLPRRCWNVTDSTATYWQQLTEDWNHLEPDGYLEAGANFRQRRYGRFSWSPSIDSLRAIHNEPYFQPKQENSYAGGIQRSFAPLAPQTMENPFLHELIRNTFSCLPVSVCQPPATWEIRIHQIRIIAAPGKPGLPAPEGIHQDGTAYLTLHLVARRNVAGGTTTVYDLEKCPIWSHTLLEPLDSLILDDPRLFHGVTPVTSADGSQIGTRDMLGIDFISSSTPAHHE